MAVLCNARLALLMGPHCVPRLQGQPWSWEVPTAELPQ